MRNIVVFIELLEPADEEAPQDNPVLLETIKVVNDARNSIARRADCQSILDEPEQIESLIESELDSNQLDGEARPLIASAARAVADDIVRGCGARPDAVEPLSPLTFFQADEIVDWGVLTQDSQSPVLPVLTIYGRQEFRIATCGADRELLQYRTGRTTLIADRDVDDPEVKGECRFYLRVICAVTDCTVVTLRLLEGLMEQYEALQKPVVPRLEELIPAGHPLRDKRSELELATLQDFRVGDLVALLGIDDGKVRRMIGKCEIAVKKAGAVIVIPRAEFLRLAVLHHGERGGQQRQALEQLSGLLEKAQQAVVALSVARH